MTPFSPLVQRCGANPKTKKTEKKKTFELRIQSKRRACESPMTHVTPSIASVSISDVLRHQWIWYQKETVFWVRPFRPFIYWSPFAKICNGYQCSYSATSIDIPYPTTKTNYIHNTESNSGESAFRISCMVTLETAPYHQSLDPLKNYVVVLMLCWAPKKVSIKQQWCTVRQRHTDAY